MERFVNRCILSQEGRSDGVVDGRSSESIAEDAVTGVGREESEMERLVPVRGCRREARS